MSNHERQFSIQALDIRNAGRDFSDNSQVISINLSVVNCGNSTSSPSNSVRTNDSPVQASREPKAGGKSWKRGLLKAKSPSLANSLQSRSVASGTAKGNEVQASVRADAAAESPLNVSAMDHLPSSSQTPSRPAFHQIYVDRLLDAGHGLPCWEPRPFSNDLHTKGAVPGDVGTYTTQQGFHKVFNLWEDKEAFHAYARTCGTKGSTCEDLGGQVITRRNVLRKGEVIAPGAICSSSPLPVSRETNQPYSVVHEFQYGSASGAILAPISTADLVATDDNEAMQTYIVQHAEAIYRYAKSIRGIGVGEPLCIVTGSIKSDMWAIAAYQQTQSPGQGTTRTLRLATSQANTENNASSTYHWTLTPESSYARIGESGVKDLRNQNLFLQGFKLSFSPQFVRRMNEDSLGGGTDASGPGESSEGPHDLSRQDGGGSHSSGGNTSQGQGSGSATNQSSGSRFRKWGFKMQQLGEEQQSPYESSISTSLTDITMHSDCEMELSQFPYDEATTLHPCDSINEVLLKLTNADVALSHDDDWRHLFHSVAASRCSATSSTIAIGNYTNTKHTLPRAKLYDPAPQAAQQIRSISVSNGVAFLKPLEVQKPGSIFPGVAIAEVTPRLRGQGRQGKASRYSTSSEESKEYAFSPSCGSRIEVNPQGQSRPYEMTKSYSLSELSISFQEAPSRGKFFSVPWKKASKPIDPKFEGHCNDVVVVVMGPAGVGKSTFINAYMGEEVSAVGDGMDLCTQQVSYFPHVLPDSHPTCPGRRVVFIDTPGFDDTYTLQYETFRRIAVCLASAYENRLPIANIIYLNSVSQKHVWALRVEYEVFRKLCGDHVSPMVTMATTHWDSAGLESVGVGVTRENEFRTNLWKDILDAGANLERVQDYKADPERIINEVLRRAHERELSMMSVQIQEELVEKWKRLPDTEAGKQLGRTLTEFEQRLKESEYETDLEKKRQKMASVKEQLDALDVPWFEKVKDVFRSGRRGGGTKRSETSALHDGF